MTDTTLELTTLTPAETVTRFLEAAQNEDTAFAEIVLDENLVYENVGLPTIYGRQATLKVFEPLKRPQFGFEVDIHRTTTNGNTVMNERHDAIVLGPLRLQFWVCGVFEVSDRGTITLWRDYFDMFDILKATVRGLIGIPFPAVRAQF
jgi:limonene-1,2-epoxide hydrolase